MKNLIIFVTVLMSINVFAANAKPTLQCWNAFFTQARVPFMSATIEKENVLSHIRFYYKNNDGQIPTAPAGKIEGEEITTNRSPYKGMIDYNINVSLHGMDRLILPADLSNDNLAAISKSKRNRENGVIIGTIQGDGAGSHFSVRLVCTSNM